jgi:hypothetical protein
LLTEAEAEKREIDFEKSNRRSGFFFNFYDPKEKTRKKILTIDPTAFPDHLAQYANHENDARKITSKPQAIVVDGKAHVILRATKYIEPDDEITFNYDPQFSRYATDEQKKKYFWHMKRPKPRTS